MKLPLTIHDDVVALNTSRLFVFAEARSGSNWLVETINSHKEVFLLKEIMQPLQKIDFYKGSPDRVPVDESDVVYIEKQLAVGNGKLKGCKILFPQAVRFMDLYEFIFNYQNANFILLTRINSVHGEVSGMLAREFSAWHAQENREKRMVMIDPRFLHQRILWRSQTTAFCSNMIKLHCPNVFELTYEDLFDNTPDKLVRIFNFLHLKNHDVSISKEIKMNPTPLSELIINYQEVKEYFKNLDPFFSMFD
jgi:hypothetical protein